MITHISLRNFQSWKKLDIDLGGITVIVGKGNGGKSAIVRALRNALTNRGGDGFITHGTDEAVVGIASGQHTLVWRKRRGKGGEYDLDGQTYTKTGQTVPDDIAKATGVRGVAIDKTTTIYPQIHGQWDVPFIVKASGTQRARILGKLTKLDILVQAQLLARTDREKASRKKEGLAAERERLESTLHQMPDAPALRRDFERIREPIALAKEVDDAYAAAQRAVGNYRKAKDDYDRAEHELGVVQQELRDAEYNYGAVCDAAGLCAACPVR